MRNLFFRLYLLLILTFIGVGWSLDQLYDQVSDSEEVLTDLDLHRGTLFLLNRELARLPDDSRQEYMQALSPSFGYPVSLLDPDELTAQLAMYNQVLTESQQTYLRQGGQVSVIDDGSGLSWFLQAQSDSENIILFGPIRLVAENDSTLFSAIFLLVLALIVFIWVWPLSKGLLILTRAAKSFGEGDFSSRVPTDVARPLKPLVMRFNDMAGRIQRLIRSHKELSHAVSHELRTPIARIRFAMEMTRELPDSDKREYYFEAMNENIEELDGLVDELLTYARFDREEPKLDFEPCKIATLTEEVVARFEMTEAELNFKIVASSSVPIVADCDQDGIARVLDNLLRNAIRYAKKEIVVSIEENNGLVNVAVADDGPGVPQANWDSLFDPFVRLDKSRDRNSGGIGLGLAIVRRYMEWHNGNVTIADAASGGAQFTLSWPVKHHD